MRLHVHRIALEAVTHIASVVTAVRRVDRSLADQLRRSASSIVLNIAEAEYSDPGTARSRFHSAAGSANETRAALRLAEAWGYVSHVRVAAIDTELDRVLRMLSPLTGRR